jgi:alpha/beta superfamily hydrolase
MEIDDATATLTWDVVSDQPVAPGERAVRLRTERAGAGLGIETVIEPLSARLHPAESDVIGGIVCVGGAGDGVDGPARGLYPDLCRRLQRHGVTGLRISYRHPNNLDECVLDTLLGLEFLADEGVETAVLLGHSFGGAVVITAGALSERVVAVVALSTQTYGTDLAPDVSPRPLLLVHGTDDEVLPDLCSVEVHRRALEPKELRLLPGTGHDLAESGEEVRDLLEAWIVDRLRSPAPEGRATGVDA